MGLSLAAKFLTIYALGWIGLVICYRMWVVERRSPLSHRIGASLGHGLLFGGGVLLTVLAIYLWYDLPALLRSAFGMRVAMREAFGSWPANNRDEILEFWRYHAPLVLLAAYGLLANLRKAPQGFLLSSWFFLIVVSLRIQNPLYHQHLQLLLPLIGLLCGLAVATLAEQIIMLRRRGVTLYRVATSAVGLLLLGQLLLFTGTTDRAYNRYTEVTQTGLREGQEPAIEFLQKFTAPTDCVVTDDLNLAFISRRFPPAMLIDLSNARLVTDSISDNRLERITTRAGCQVVALFTDRIVDYSPGFAVWSEEAFLGTWLGDGNDALWLAQPLADPHPMLPLQIKLGDQVVLQGADLDVDPGQQVLYVSSIGKASSP
ncbi:MAG: hypothetical protein R2867_03000 [Caldilineaceae bacterium]